MQTRTREATLAPAEASEDEKTVPVVLSTEHPVDRGPFLEVLDHSPGAVDLNRSPLPFIESHDTGRLNIGVVERLRLDGDKLRGILRLGTSNRAAEVFQDIRAGILRSVSIGYRIHEARDEGETMRVTRWEPFECSAVSVPADPNAGFFRTYPNEDQTMTNQDTHMTRSERRNLKAAQEAESQRSFDLKALGHAYSDHGGIALAEQAIREGRDKEWLRQALLENMSSRGPDPALQPFDSMAPAGGGLGLSNSEMEEYSLARAIRMLMDPKEAQKGGIELEAHRALVQEHRRETTGLLVPLEVQLQQVRGYAARNLLTAAATGSDLVGTDHMGGSFIDVLRNNSMAFQVGMQPMSGLQGNVQIPIKTSASTAAWIDGDGADALPDSGPGLDSISLSPRTVGGLASFSRRMLLQSSPEIEGLLRSDLADTLAVEIDRAALNGAGSSNEPTGILNTSGINSDTYSGDPAYADLVNLETLVSDHNADSPRSVYAVTPGLRGTLKSTDIGTDTGTMIWTNQSAGMGMVNGYGAFATKNMPADTVLFGDFSQVLFGEWGIMELMVDPYHDFDKGSVRVRVLYSCDIALRHPKAFAKLTLE
ncbi:MULTISPECIES: phage major capsid protein [unclassified Thioalkalivibrio]|uniref:phage major capsid protein n=1 Tax=unclassified Thioalkalivibrio TaxID=2621013 RepID=UPI0003662F3E|nr:MULTISPECIES: phage major capsid protein [unclassified Thioalkalivibrio]